MFASPVVGFLRSFSSSIIDEVDKESLLPSVLPVLLALNLFLLLSALCFKSIFVKPYPPPAADARGKLPIIRGLIAGLGCVSAGI